MKNKPPHRVKDNEMVAPNECTNHCFCHYFYEGGVEEVRTCCKCSIKKEELR